ncbi:hypothetical protein [Rugosimonospora africana]|uniref:Uncharacterized protein n=1 Tax=Rugosimonospora africana TaxID=556532 RepID=A0A8J3VSF3_9ACTN|nr:hypothetical protein [Rugosimonospora africana]GIH17217.1 hypothetical protein Raf01_53890 [Rugosimonospora africana]
MPEPSRDPEPADENGGTASASTAEPDQTGTGAVAVPDGPATTSDGYEPL